MLETDGRSPQHSLNEAIKKITEGLEALKAYVAAPVPVERKKDTKEANKSAISPKYVVAKPSDTLPPAPELEPAWPNAVPSHMIVSDADETTKQFRAVQVVGIMGVPLSNLHVLDFGCGDGFVSREIASTAKSVLGYDIKRHDAWPSHRLSNLLLSTDIDEVYKNGPYDQILAFDVIDHLEDAELDQTIKMLSSLLRSDGKMFIRFHPWTSKHGSHLYSKINKAYVHLAFTESELANMGYTLEPNIKIVRPLAAYDLMLSKNGFKIDNRKGHSEEVDYYFDGALLDRMNHVTWKGKADRDSMLRIMGLQFIDYHLSKA